MRVTPELAADLAALLGDRFTTAPAELVAHEGSESHFDPTPPEAVAYPISTEETAAIMAACHRHRCPVVAWGAGTSLEAQALAVKGGLCVDFARMNAVIEVNAADMDARVGPGLTREALNDYLRDQGLFFPVDPGANASLGGMASTRASGTTTVRYGTMADNVLGLTVVLADGRVIRTGGRARKSATGYDLTHLFVGAEGTLGLMTELTLRLHGLPQSIATAVCAFDTMTGCVDTVIETVQSGIPMARIEFVDAVTAAIVNRMDGAGLTEAPHLLVEFHGSDAAVAEDIATFGDIARAHGASQFDWASRTEDRNRLWRIRHRAYWSCLASRPGARAIVTDACVPISRLAEAVAETQADISASGLVAPILGHVGDGNFHAILMIDPASASERAVAAGLAKRISDRALALGGTISGEHGVGLGKIGMMRAEHGEAVAVMRAIKEALDPLDLLNPGKTIP